MTSNTAKDIISEVAAILFVFAIVAFAVEIPLIDVGSVIIGAGWVALAAVPVCAFRGLRAAKATTSPTPMRAVHASR